MNKWISIKDKLPKHHETILVFTPRGQGVCIFLDSVIMNRELVEKGYPSEQVDTRSHPYYFCSQETKQHTLNGVTHWMTLPEPPT